MVSTTATELVHVGNGTTISIPVPFLFLQDDDLIVVEKNVSTSIQTPLTLNIDYTVTGALQELGGTIEANVAPPVGVEWHVLRQTDLTQEVDYINNDGFPADANESALDKLTLIAQESHNKLLENEGRALLYPISEDSSTSNILPSKGDRAGLNFVWSGTGEPAAGSVLASGNIINDSDMGGDNPSPTDAASQASVKNFVDTRDPLGVPKPYFGSSAPSGHILAAGTIGSNASGAIHTTTTAGQDTEPLYTHFWNQCADAQCPVSGGRGASAAADYAANKTLTLPDIEGTTLRMLTDMVGSSNNRITVAGSGLDGTILAAVGGSETHQLIGDELPSISPSGSTNTSGNHNHAGSSTNTTGAHIHSVNAVPTSTDNAAEDGVSDREAAAPDDIDTTSAGDHSHTLTITNDGDHSHTVSINALGNDDAHNNLGPTTMVNAIYRL